MSWKASVKILDYIHFVLRVYLLIQIHLQQTITVHHGSLLVLSGLAYSVLVARLHAPPPRNHAAGMSNDCHMG